MIEWALTEGVYELRLGQAPCNEIGTTMLSALERFLDQVDTESAHALVIRSTVRGGFSAGADLRELYQGLRDRPEREHEPLLREFLDRIHSVMNRLDMLPLTTIGVIHGICFGGGFELALTCDILIAEKSARFGFPELRLGIIPGFGGIPRLRRDVGNAVVRDLLLTGRSINAKKAQSLGLVSQMVPAGEGLRAALATARQATKFDREAAKTCKRFMKPLPLEELAQEKEHFVRLALRPVLKLALKKFVESEDPRPYLP
jgi:enoyl-CoA hydratase/carnithine racemase